MIPATENIRKLHSKQVKMQLWMKPVENAILKKMNVILPKDDNPQENDTIQAWKRKQFILGEFPRSSYPTRRRQKPLNVEETIMLDSFFSQLAWLVDFIVCRLSPQNGIQGEE